MSNFKIYPKEFRNDKISIVKNKCFMMMQFSDDLNEVYGIIKEELDKKGYICNRADDTSSSPVVLNKILKEILSSRFIIADLTHNNPNVFYELGIAHSFKDASNIILIKQRDSKCPFDISHLTYIEYSPNNLKYLVSQIKNQINSNQNKSDFYDMLNIKGIINIVCDNQDEFVEYIQAELSSDIPTITEVINNGGYTQSHDEQERIFKHFEDAIVKIANERLDIINGVLNLYYQLILSCAPSQVSEVFTNRFLNYNFGTSNEVSWKTDLAVKLAENKKLMNVCMPWIINYFGQPHATTIDLNRYKLEKLLMTTNYDEVNEGIINAIFSKNCYIREFMSDIIGEKRLTKALCSLYTQLEIEENCYAARSMIQAISKLDDVSGIVKLNDWLERKLSIILEKKFYSVLKHMHLATVRLDNTPDKRFIKNFKEKYSNYINDYLF